MVNLLSRFYYVDKRGRATNVELSKVNKEFREKILKEAVVWVG